MVRDKFVIFNFETGLIRQYVGDVRITNIGGLKLDEAAPNNFVHTCASRSFLILKSAVYADKQQNFIQP
jgi:hypothetical protein